MERVILSGCLLFLLAPASLRDTVTTPIDPGVETKTGCDSVKRADKFPRPGQNSPTLALTTITGRTQGSISPIHNCYPAIYSIATWRSYRSNGPLRGLSRQLATTVDGSALFGAYGYTVPSRGSSHNNTLVGGCKTPRYGSQLEAMLFGNLTPSHILASHG